MQTWISDRAQFDGERNEFHASADPARRNEGTHLTLPSCTPLTTTHVLQKRALRNRVRFEEVFNVRGGLGNSSPSPPNCGPPQSASATRTSVSSTPCSGSKTRCDFSAISTREIVARRRALPEGHIP